MIYIVFDTETECAEANGLWLLARMELPEFDRCLGVVVDPQITSAWDYGKVMLDGRIACQVPEQFKTEFMGDVGIEMELTEDDFPIVETEI